MASSVEPLDDDLSPNLHRMPSDPIRKTSLILGVPLALSLTLGLAPFSPEPHLVGKVRWVLGGGEGMALLDYGDLLWHGAPWLWLLGAAVYVAARMVRRV